MKCVVLSKVQRDAVALANWRLPARQLAPMYLADGRWAIGADVLEDRQTWGEHLNAVEEVEPLAEPVNVDEKTEVLSGKTEVDGRVNQTYLMAQTVEESRLKDLREASKVDVEAQEIQRKL